MTPILAFLRTLPIVVYLGGGLIISVGLNYTQWAHAQAAEAECRVKLAEQQLQAKADADAQRARLQGSLDQAAADHVYIERETLSQIVAGVQRTQSQLARAVHAKPSPVDCRVDAERVYVVNAALAIPRAARPAL